MTGSGEDGTDTEADRLDGSRDTAGEGAAGDGARGPRDRGQSPGPNDRGTSQPEERGKSSHGSGERGHRGDTRGHTGDDHGETGRGPEPRTTATDTLRREKQPQEESDDWVYAVRDVGVTVLAVVLIGAYLFAISGVWPPMVAIESGSMEPNMEVNDMVFVMETDRFQPAAANGDTGVVTAWTGANTRYGQYGNPGDVIIFEPGGNDDETPIIHRAMFWVEAGENWCEQANPSYLGGLDPGDEVCEADHDGFITKGDANSNYDQASIGRASGPVKPEWVIGTAELRLPRLGWFRLQF